MFSFSKWQFINAIEVENILSVVIGASVFEPGIQVVEVWFKSRLIVIGCVGCAKCIPQSFLECVVGLEQQPLREATANLHLQCVVAEYSDVLNQIRASGHRIRSERNCASEITLQIDLHE